MSARAEAFAAAAAAMAGVPFRLRGRDPVSGVDCVGLVAVALSQCGQRVCPPEGYALRMGDVGRWLSFAARNGFVAVDRQAAPQAGDLLLLQVSAVQPHLAIAMGSKGFVHAHAGLARVVVEAGTPSWPVAARWRLPAHD
jgi:cell wall-associated NlpC family hydrolase